MWHNSLATAYSSEVQWSAHTIALASPGQSPWQQGIYMPLSIYNVRGPRVIRSKASLLLSTFVWGRAGWQCGWTTTELPRFHITWLWTHVWETCFFHRPLLLLVSLHGRLLPFACALTIALALASTCFAELGSSLTIIEYIQGRNSFLGLVLDF